MKKAIVIGIIVVVIIAAIIGAASSLDLETDDDSSIDNIEENESIPVEENVTVPETTGRDLSVELSEKVGLTSP